MGLPKEWEGAAGWPGQGPQGQRCETCAHWQRIGKDETINMHPFGICNRRHQLFAKRVTQIRIAGRVPACQYWEKISA